MDFALLLEMPEVKNPICILALIVSIVLYAGANGEMRATLRNGAKGKYIYTVVNDAGQPVVGVCAHVWFTSYGRPQDKADWIVETDTNGMFTVEHRFNEKFSVVRELQGYWST